MTLKLILLSAVSGLLDSIGVFSIMPFVAAVQNPEYISSNDILTSFTSYLDIKNDELIVFFGIIVLFVFLFGSAIKLFLIYFQTTFIHRLEAESANYSLNQIFNSGFGQLIIEGRSVLSRKLFSESEQLVKYIFFPFVNIISNSFLLFFVLSSLVLVFGVQVFAPFIFVIIVYLLIFSLGRRFISRFSASRSFYNKKRFRIVDDITNYFANILVDSSSSHWIDKFSLAEQKFLRSKIGVDVFNNTPRLALELLIVFSGVLTILVFIDADSNSIFNPVYISFLVVAAYKMIPSFQMLYKSINSIYFGFDIFRSHIGEDIVSNSNDFSYFQFSSESTYILSVRSLCYSYQSNHILENVNLDIPSKGITLLFGPSGSGKSTLIHIILGLLPPNSGKIFLSDVLNVSSKGYLTDVSFVPQGSPLFSGTVFDNLSISSKQSDVDKAISALEAVNLLDEFNEMGIELDSFLSERGDSLSGGQRQRLSIARALFNESKLIILDEPTSGLDSNNSNLIHILLHEISKKIPIIIVSHDKTLTDHASSVYYLSDSKLKNIKHDNEK